MTWSSPEGLVAVKDILDQLAPLLKFSNGPHFWQVQCVAHILDKLDVFLVAACGSGKTAATYLPIFVLLKLYKNTALPRFWDNSYTIPSNPVTLIVSPLNDLSACQVDELTSKGLRAVSLDSATIGAAKKNHERLFRQVAAGHYQVVIVSPERLNTPEFDAVLRDETFRRSLVLYVIDEVHVVGPWSKEFRPSYRHIDPVRSRIPEHVPLLAMTATSQPGKREKNLQQRIGQRPHRLRLLRLPNEQTNLQLVFCTLNHGIGGFQFPDIAWVACGKWKTIIYCATIPMCNRVAVYLRMLRPPGQQRKRNIREYHSLLGDDVNRQTIKDFVECDDTFIIIATIKLSLGVDIRNVQIAINLGLPKTVEQDLQQKGRAGRDRSINAVGITYVEMSIIGMVRKALEKGLKPDGTSNQNGKKGKSGKGKAQPDSSLWEHDDESVNSSRQWESRVMGLDPAIFRLVRCHISGTCLVSETNQIFGNTTTPTSTQSCHTAQRPLPCSSCLRDGPLTTIRKTLLEKFEENCALTQAMSATPIPPSTELEELFSLDDDGTTVPSGRSQLSGASDYKALTAKMRKGAQTAIMLFSRKCWLAGPNPKADILPYAAHIPGELWVDLLDNLHLIRDREALAGVMDGWEYMEDLNGLFDVVSTLNISFDQEHEAARAAKAAKSTETRRQKALAQQTAKQTQPTTRGQKRKAGPALEDENQRSLPQLPHTPSKRARNHEPPLSPVKHNVDRRPLHFD